MPTKLTPEQRLSIIKRYLAGETGTVLGAEFNISPAAVSLMTSRSGLQVTRKRGARRKDGSWKHKPLSCPIIPNAYPDVMHKLMAGR